MAETNAGNPIISLFVALWGGGEHHFDSRCLMLLVKGTSHVTITLDHSKIHFSVSALPTPNGRQAQACIFFGLVAIGRQMAMTFHEGTLGYRSPPTASSSLAANHPCSFCSSLGQIHTVDGKIQHHFETMGHHCLFVFTGESSFQCNVNDVGPSIQICKFTPTLRLMTHDPSNAGPRALQ